MDNISKEDLIINAGRLLDDEYLFGDMVDTENDLKQESSDK